MIESKPGSAEDQVAILADLNGKRATAKGRAATPTTPSESGRALAARLMLV